MKRKVFALLSAFVAATLLLSACTLFGPAASVPTPTGNVFTQSAQTLEAATLFPSETAVVTSTSVLPNTGSSTIPTETSLPEPTSTPALPTFTPTVAPVVAGAPCNWMQFVSDVAIPDGTPFVAGTTFTKVWRLRNIGTCTWTTDYALVYVSGPRMGASAAVHLPTNVAPGATVDLALNLVAPPAVGRQRSYWILRDANGNAFGTGPDASQAIWVDINVTLQPNQSFAYDFAANLCAATWRTNLNQLACPTGDNGDRGSVSVSSQPALETGRTENELTIISVPPLGRNTWIQGRYPVYRVNPGDHFLADIGCLAQSNGCNVTFTLNYVLNNEQQPQALGSWRETLDGKIQRVDLDLAPFAGRDIQFFLAVINNSQSGTPNAFWLAPSIRNIVNPPVTAAPNTDTPTLPPPTATPPGAPTSTRVPLTATATPLPTTPAPSSTPQPPTLTPTLPVSPTLPILTPTAP